MGNILLWLQEMVGCKQRTVVHDQPDQVKPPWDPQLLLVELVELEDDALKEATLEIFFFVFLLSHFGQAGRRSASEKRSVISNASPHSLQRYSYKGISRFP